MRMRYLWGCVVLFVMVSTGAAQGTGFGLGISIGEPTGLSGKQWLSTDRAIDGGIAWSFRGEGYFHLHADYLWHFSSLGNPPVRILPYVGIGGRLGARSGDAVIGVRIPVGLVYLPRGAPIDLFVELAPILDLAPATEMEFDGSIGIRYFF
jgi:hypothetical protein